MGRVIEALVMKMIMIMKYEIWNMKYEIWNMKLDWVHQNFDDKQK
jgi:hypothetical protein